MAMIKIVLMANAFNKDILLNNNIFYADYL